MQDCSTQTDQVCQLQKERETTVKETEKETGRNKMILSPEREAFPVSVAAPPATNTDTDYTPVT